MYAICMYAFCESYMVVDDEGGAIFFAHSLGLKGCIIQQFLVGILHAQLNPPTPLG
jgi:hypothetical protein